MNSIVLSCRKGMVHLCFSSMTQQHTCWDFGGTCDEVIDGDTVQEATDAMVAHLQEAHPENAALRNSIPFNRIKRLIEDAYREEEDTSEAA